MNSNCKICIIVRRAIIERVALLYNRILRFSAQASVGVKWRFRHTTWLVDMETLFTYKLL